MNPSDRHHIHGPLRPMDAEPPAGSVRPKIPRPSQDRTRIVIALASFWLAMAILCLLLSCSGS